MTEHSKPTTPPPPPAMNLSNRQVALILVAVGIFLLIPTWFFAKDIGRIPVSLWDICTTVLPSSDSKTDSKSAPSAQTAGAPQKTQ